MSLLDELAAELRATVDDLPLPTLRHAMTEAHHAYDGLAAVNRLGDAGSGDAGLRNLGAATSHLENGAGLIMRAQDEVGAYLAEIGGDRRPVVIGTQRAEPSDLCWARRIARLTTETGAGCDDSARTAGELMQRIARAVADGDRAGLHRQLVGAGAGLGSSLAGLAMAALRGMADSGALAVGDALHGPAPEARMSVRTGPADVADLLPGLPAQITATVLAQARGNTAGARAAGGDPTDLAVGAAVIAARLGHLLGRNTVEAAHA